MTLKFYTVYGCKLLATWDNYPIIPNVRDRISVKGNQFEVYQRIFCKDSVKILLN